MTIEASFPVLPRTNRECQAAEFPQGEGGAVYWRVTYASKHVVEISRRYRYRERGKDVGYFSGAEACSSRRMDCRQVAAAGFYPKLNGLCRGRYSI